MSYDDAIDGVTPIPPEYAERAAAGLRERAKQRDAAYKMRVKKAGGHYHCSLFSRYVEQSTPAKIGVLVVAEDEIASFVRAMSGVEVQFTGEDGSVAAATQDTPR